MRARGLAVACDLHNYPAKTVKVTSAKGLLEKYSTIFHIQNIGAAFIIAFLAFLIAISRLSQAFLRNVYDIVIQCVFNT